MNSSCNATTVQNPAIVWAQRKDTVILTVQLENCKNPTVDIKEKCLHFKGKGGAKNSDYEVTMEFFKEINPKDSKFSSSGREVIIALKKKEESQGFWPRLLLDTKKAHYLKTDFNKWRDEDESDQEDQDDFNLDDMMKSMSGMQGDGDVGGQGLGADDAEDSDDEELPDLQ